MKDKKSQLNIPSPDLQIDFALALRRIRSLCLQEALGQTIRGLDISQLDKELGRFVPPKALAEFAQHGLRGELAFPVPIVLRANPRLLGYYRLLLGHSQKEFYSRLTGAGRFKAMEAKGQIPKTLNTEIPAFCRALTTASVLLLHGISGSPITRELLDDLALLTLGPQLRGGRNNTIGAAAIVRVFDIIRGIVKRSDPAIGLDRMVIKNAAGRTVLIEFSPDPDITIREEIATDDFRNILAIEIKGGTDFHNIHNRLGEAEKTHQKARLAGFAEYWTIVNVERMDENVARRESPSTNRFYQLSKLSIPSSPEYRDFRNRIAGLSGIA